MSLLERVQSGVVVKPRRTVLYATHGFGKSTWGSLWPSPLYLPTEEGVNDIDVPKMPLYTSVMELWHDVMELGGPEIESPYGTIVLDTADWLEKLIWAEVAKRHEKKHVSEIGYGKGYDEASSMMLGFLKGLNCVINNGMHVLILAHCEIKRFDSPDGSSYDRYQPKLHKASAGVLQEWADEVFFGNYRTFVRTTDKDMGKERQVGVGTGERVLYTSERPGHKAKNRLGLPPEIDFESKDTLGDFKQYLPNLEGPASPSFAK